ncbi:hypothetical protein D3C85_709580 [compost metagenome]
MVYSDNRIGCKSFETAATYRCRGSDGLLGSGSVFPVADRAGFHFYCCLAASDLLFFYQRAATCNGQA